MDNKMQRRFAVLAGGLVTLLGFQAASAVAQEGAIAQDEKSPFSFSVSQEFRRDNNIYRLPDECPGSSNPSCRVPKDKRGDTISFTRAGVDFDKQYSRQTFHAGLAVRHTAYSTHSSLSNTEPDARLRWDWRLGNRLSGVFGYSYNESFVSFSDTYAVDATGRDKIMRQLSRANASADFWWHPNWATGFSFSDVRNDYRNNERPYDKYDEQTWGLNFTYRPSTGNRIVLSYLAKEGQYPNRDKNPGSLRDWNQRDVRLSAQWRLTGVTQLNGYVGHTKREYEWAPNRDFSGVTGKIGFLWTPTGKAIIDLSWRREIGADMDAISNFAVSQGWALKPTWVITSKIRLGASYEYLKRDYRGDPGLGSWALPRDAKTTSYGLNLQYLPVPYANIRLGYDDWKRDATEKRYDSSARIWSLSGGVTF